MSNVGGDQNLQKGTCLSHLILNSSYDVMYKIILYDVIDVIILMRCNYALMCPIVYCTFEHMDLSLCHGCMMCGSKSLSWHSSCLINK